jgi:dipeptidyl aminopeptidase/acylaminoacyl peptidase
MSMPTRTNRSGATKRAAASRAFAPRDLLEETLITGLAMAPDGSSAVYARRTIEGNKYRKRLWRVSFEGGRPEQLTTADASDSRPRFSPDGRSLLFLSDRSGRTQPWVLPLAGGEPKQLADLKGDVKEAEWSPDGRRIALVSPSGEERYKVGDAKDPIARRVRDMTWRLDEVGIRDQYASAWVVGSAGGRARRLTSPDAEASGVFWSPDSRRIGFLADLGPDAWIHEIPQAWSVPAAGGRVSKAAELAGSVGAAAWSRREALAIIGPDVAESPDWANWSLHISKRGTLHRLGADLDRPTVNVAFGDIADGDDWLTPPFWLDDDNVVVIVSDRGTALPYRFGTGGDVERLADREFICTGLAVGGGRVAVVATDRGRHPEVYAVEDGSFRPLSDNGSRWFAPFRRDPERTEVPLARGRVMDAWLVPARGRSSKPRPLVVQIHGGPHGSHGPAPWLEMVALADEGINVLYPNPTGSSGYGERYARDLHEAWGDPDGQEIMRMVEWAAAEGLADPTRVGILGLSYGGYLVNWLLGHFPGRFAAAVSENPVTDMVSEFGASDYGLDVDARAVGAGSLPEDLEEFLRRSPYLLMDRNEAPTLFLQSELDLRCPAHQTELVYTMLRMRGRPVEMIRYPGEYHWLAGTGRPDRRVDRLERIVGCFTKYLQGPPRRGKAHAGRPPKAPSQSPGTPPRPRSTWSSDRTATGSPP